MLRAPSTEDYVISIHALRGEGDFLDKENYNALEISIHALRGEGDYH